MSEYKVQISGQKPLARLCYEDDSPYPGWYARYRLKGKLRKIAVSTWDRNDVEGAVAETAKLLRCPPERIQVDSRQIPLGHPSHGSAEFDAT